MTKLTFKFLMSRLDRYEILLTRIPDKGIRGKLACAGLGLWE